MTKWYSLISDTLSTSHCPKRPLIYTIYSHDGDGKIRKIIYQVVFTPSSYKWFEKRDGHLSSKLRVTGCDLWKNSISICCSLAEKSPCMKKSYSQSIARCRSLVVSKKLILWSKKCKPYFGQKHSRWPKINFWAKTKRNVVKGGGFSDISLIKYCTCGVARLPIALAV